MIDKTQKINELFDIGGDTGGNASGGVQDYDNNRKTPKDNKEHDLIAGGGEIGGSDAVSNDATRFVDWINGNGAYGRSGRDFSYSIASMAIVNPMAAGAVLGAIGTASVVHGMCTSSWARFTRAQRRLKKIYTSVMSDKGYNSSDTLWNAIWRNFKVDGVEGYNEGIGPNAFNKRINADIDEAIKKINAAKIVKDVPAGGRGHSMGVSNNISDYTDTNASNKIGSILMSSISNLYIPRSYTDKESTMYQKFLDSITTKAGGQKSSINFSDWEKIAKKKQNINSFTPIERRAEDQVDEIKMAGDNICKEYERLMQYSLKKGDMAVRNRVDKLNSFWKRCMESISKKYEQIISDIKEGDKMMKLSSLIDAISNVQDSVSKFINYEGSVEVGDILVGKVNPKAKISRTYEVIQVSGYGSNEILVRVCNSNVLKRGSGIIYKMTTDYLYDIRKDIRRFIPTQGGKNGATSVSSNKSKGGSSFYLINIPANSVYGGGRIGGGGSSNMDQYLYVQANEENMDPALLGASYFGTGTPSGSTDCVVFSIVNFDSSKVKPTLFWMPKDVFNQYVVIGGYIEENKLENVSTSANIDFDKTLILNEDEDEVPNIDLSLSYDDSDTNTKDEDNQESNSSSEGESDNSNDSEFVDIKNATDDDIDSKLKECTFVLSAQYLLRSGNHKGEVVETGDIIANKVKFVFVSKKTEAKEEIVDMSEWNSWDPIQIAVPTTVKGFEEPTPNPTPDDDNDDDPENIFDARIETDYPLTYRTFNNVYMQTYALYEPYIKKYVNELKPYSIVTDNDGNVKGLADFGNDEKFVMNSICNPDMFDRYILFLDKNILFNNEDEFKELFVKEYSESFDYGIIDGILNEDYRDPNVVSTNTKKQQLVGKTNRGMMSTFVSYYKNKFNKLSIYKGNEKEWNKTYEANADKNRKILRQLDVEYFVQYATMICASFLSDKVKEAFIKLGKKDEFDKMLTDVNELIKSVYKEKKKSVKERKIIKYTDNPKLSKDDSLSVLFFRADRKEVPIFDDAITKLKKCLEPYVEFIKTIPNNKKKKVVDTIKDDIKKSDEKISEIRKESENACISNEKEDTKTDNTEKRDEPITDSEVLYIDKEDDIEDFKKELVEALKEVNLPSDIDEKKLIDAPNVVKKICAEIKHDLDENARKVLESRNKSIKEHLKKGGYLFKKDEWENARAKDYTSESTPSSSTNPSSAYFNRYGNGWVVVELMEDHAKNNNTDTEEYHFKFEDKEIVFKGSAWMNDINSIELAVPYSVEGGDAIWTYMQRNTGLKRGRTYTTKKENFDSFIGESFADRFFKDMMLFESNSNVPDDSEIFLVKDVVVDGGKFVLTTSDNKDHDVLYTKIVEKTMQDGKFVGFDLFDPYRINLVEGATYKIEDSEYFDSFFSDLKGESDEQRAKFMNEVHIKNNDAFMSTVKFAVGGKEFDKHYFDIDISKFDRVEDKKEEPAVWWKEGSRYEISSEYYTNNIANDGDNVDTSNEYVKISIGKEEKDLVSVTFIDSGVTREISKEIMLNIPEDARRDVSYRPFFGEGGITTNVKPILSKEQIDKFAKLKDMCSTNTEMIQGYLTNNNDLYKQITKDFVGVPVSDKEDAIKTFIEVLNSFLNNIIVVDGSNDIQEGLMYDVYYVNSEKNVPSVHTCICKHVSTGDSDNYIISINSDDYIIQRKDINNIIFVRRNNVSESINYGGFVSFLPNELRKCEMYNLSLNEAIVIDLGIDKSIKTGKLIEVMNLLIQLYDTISRTVSDSDSEDEAHKK